MKFLAVLLLCCIVFLSTFSGMVKPLQLVAKKNCCQRVAGQKVCHQKNARNDDGCNKPGCVMLLTCNICGFLTEQALSIHPGYLPFNQQPVSLYKIGELSAYHKSDWKPPKAC